MLAGASGLTSSHLVQHTPHTRIHESSTGSPTRFSSCTQREGATTTLDSDGFSHAPHQLNVLFAITWCEHRLMRHMSSQSLPAGSARSTTCVGTGSCNCRLHHDGSSEKTKASTSPTRA